MASPFIPKDGLASFLKEPNSLSFDKTRKAMHARYNSFSECKTALNINPKLKELPPLLNSDALRKKAY